MIGWFRSGIWFAPIEQFSGIWDAAGTWPKISDGRGKSRRAILVLRMMVRPIQSQVLAGDGEWFSLSHRMPSVP